ncbi:STAS/SEC14 domain-containing protein [Alteribacter natronophilus]|uniref:STAS/SEC14 domain-containing protein n=1 Tax=Alteribacter natronophilus TaxID=2583810 RepID=UPI00110E8ECF|nr:STAS/SEC14 domain-containing protein [Alteribacter natronophilus]TMW72765.1 STAS/SEC14 domain-containing protein [Alteribacter natronophilus]
MNRKLDWSRDNILAYEFNEKVSEEEYKGIVAEVEEKLSEYGKVRIFARIPELVGTELSTLDDRLRFLKDNDLERLEKYAIVGEAKMVETIAKGADALTGANIRHYTLDEEEKAKQWIMED